MQARGQNIGQDDMVQGNYRSKTVQLLFDPVTLYQTANGYGQQIVGTTSHSFLKQGSILYSRKYADNNYKQATDKFISDYSDYGGRMDIFNSTLRQKITASKQTVKQFNLEQIADFFPWVMSCQMTFQPVRSMLYCLSQNIPPAQFGLVSQKLSNPMINQVVNKAIFDSVKYNAPYIQLMKSAYSQTKRGYIASMWHGLQSKVYALTNTMQSISIKLNPMKLVTSGKNIILTGLSKGAKYVSDMFGNDEDLNEQHDKYIKQLDKIQDIGQMKQQQKSYRQAITSLINQIFVELRPYGQITINFSYLKKAGWVKTIQSQVYYYFPDQPSLLFTLKDSFAAVYYLNQNKLQKIPETQFTRLFLIGLITADVLKLGGRMLKQVINDTTKTAKQKQAMHTFSNNYLSWHDPLKQISARQYQRIYKNSTGKQLTNLPVNVVGITNSQQNDLIALKQAVDAANTGQNTENIAKTTKQYQKRQAEILAQMNKRKKR